MSALIPVDRMQERIYKHSTPEPNTGCWLWLASIGNSGYGKTRFNHSTDITAHRVSYMAFKGAIPQGLCVLHQCDVRTCVNPAHLFLGTKKDNSQDALKKGRLVSPPSLRTHCPQGHDYSGLNSQGRRICKICIKQNRLKYAGKK